MPRLTEANIAELERTLPSADATRQRVQDFMAKADLTTGQMAALCGYSHSSIRNWISGCYQTSNDWNLRRAIETAMDRHLISADEGKKQKGRFYETENSAIIRQWFEHCHAQAALAYCYAPPGSQKSYVARHLVAEFNQRELRLESRNRAYYIDPDFDARPRDLLALMCKAIGVRTGATKSACMTSLRQGLQGWNTVFIVDEGQNLGIPTLETLRNVYDKTANFGCLLMGSHELKQRFDRHAAQLEQWNSRIDAGVELRGVSETTARQILAEELPWLDTQDVTEILAGCTVTDRYSSTAGKRYLSIRRLFKNIEATRRLIPAQLVQESAA